MSEIRAVFEPGAWKDFSREHELLRKQLEKSLGGYKASRFQDPVAVWGAYGAGKTQFLFWVAEESVRTGLVPVYLHLNDLLEDLPPDASPDTFSRHAAALVRRVLDELKTGNDDGHLLEMFRDGDLLDFVKGNLSADASRAVVLVDEVEQAYISLKDKVRADDRSPLKAWLEEDAFKIFAFAVGSLYVLGKADRERLKISAIPAVSPTKAKELFSDLDEAAVNGIWWLSRGKPRHLLKAAMRYRDCPPKSTTETYSFVSSLDSVSQAPYEGDSQSAVPAAYVDLLPQDELANLFHIGPDWTSDEGKLFPFGPETEDALLGVVRDAFKMENVAYDLVRYVMLLADALSAKGYFALTEPDTPYLLRLAVDFLLEYERERIEKETTEGAAALRKLLEVHDMANQKAGEIFWRFQGKFKSLDNGRPVIPYASLYTAFPLPTTSPSLLGTDPRATRARYEELKQPVFEWTDSLGNTVFFVTSVASFERISTSSPFRQRALAPSGRVIVLLPHDSDDFTPDGFLACLQQQERLSVHRLPVVISDFLLSLRSRSFDGTDPFAIASQAEQDRNLRRQVIFYRARLESYVADINRKPRPIVTMGLPKTFAQIVGRVADKDMLALAMRQSFDSLSPKVSAFLYDLRQLILNTKTVFLRTGLIAVADDILPHKDVRTGRLEAAKVVDDVKIAFSDCVDFLRGLAGFVTEEEIAFLGNEPAVVVALRAVWQVKRLGHELPQDELDAVHKRLKEFLSVVKKAKELENGAVLLGVEVDFGHCGEWMEALPLLEKGVANAKELLESRTSSETNLARSLYHAFLRCFVEEEAASEAATVKHDVAIAKDLLSDVDRRKAVLKEGWSNERALFAGIAKDAIDGVLTEAFKQFLPSSGGRLPLSGFVKGLQDYKDAYESLETALNKVASAHDSILALTATETEGGNAD